MNNKEKLWKLINDLDSEKIHQWIGEWFRDSDTFNYTIDTWDESTIEDAIEELEELKSDKISLDNIEEEIDYILKNPRKFAKKELLEVIKEVCDLLAIAKEELESVEEYSREVETEIMTTSDEIIEENLQKFKAYFFKMNPNTLPIDFEILLNKETYEY